MADWQSFATGFLTSVGQEMDRKTEKAEEYEQRQRLLGERNRPAVQKRKEISQRANTAVKQLSAMGIGSAAIFAAMKSNPDTGIFELQRNAQKAIEATQRTYNRNPTPEEFESFISFSADMPEELKGDSDALSRLTAQLYGVQQAPTQAAASSEGTGSSSFIRNIFGPSLQSVDEKLKAEQAGEGLSVYDLATYSDVRPYDPTSAGAFFSFQQPDFFDPDGFAAESREIRTYMAGQLSQDTTYIAAKARYDAARPLVLQEGTSPDVMRQYNLSKEIMESKTAELLDMFVGSRAGTYEGSSYVDVMKPVLDDFVGGYVDDFTSRAEKERAELEGEIPTATPADAVPEGTTTEELISGSQIMELVNIAGGKITQDDNTYTFTLDGVEGGKTFIVSLDEEGKVGSFEVEGEAENRRTGREAREIAQSFAERNLIVSPASSGTPSNKTLDQMNTAAKIADMTPEEIKSGLKEGTINKNFVPEEVVDELSRSQKRALGSKISPLGRALEEQTMFGDGGFPSAEQLRYARGQIIYKEDAKANPDKFYKIRVPGVIGGRKIRGSTLAQVPDEVLMRRMNRFTISELPEEGAPAIELKFSDSEDIASYFGVQEQQDVTTPEEAPSSDMPPPAVPVPKRADPVLAGFMSSARDVPPEMPPALNPESVTQDVLRAREADNYNTLYGNFETDENSPVFDYKVTEKTLGELVEFSKPSNAYGKYVKPRLGKNTEARRKGLTSTPMGKYQIVGTTLRGLIKDMRLPDNLVFNKETQDAMFLFLAKQAMQGKDTPAQKRSALKETWEGFRNKSVTEEQLNEMISEIESSYGSLDEWLSRNQKQSTEQE